MSTLNETPSRWRWGPPDIQWINTGWVTQPNVRAERSQQSYISKWRFQQGYPATRIKRTAIWFTWKLLFTLFKIRILEVTPSSPWWRAGMLVICLNTAKHSFMILYVLNGTECLFFIATPKPKIFIVLQCMKWNEFTQINFRPYIKFIKNGEINPRDNTF